MLAMNGASAALVISKLPFQGPIGSVRLGMINGEFVVFPTTDQLEESELDLVISGSKDAVLMIEGFARVLPEDRMHAAIVEAHKYVQVLCELQEELAQKCGVQKVPFEAPPSDGVYEKLKGQVQLGVQDRGSNQRQARPGRLRSTRSRSKRSPT